MKQLHVIFQPAGVGSKVSEGRTVLEASRQMGVKIESLCGGLRDCGKCKIKIEEGRLSRFTKKESKFITEAERAQGYRLGCVARIRSNALIFIPEESRVLNQEIRKTATEKKIKIKPAITLYYVELSPPSVKDPLGDLDRLLKALSRNYRLPSLRS